MQDNDGSYRAESIPDYSAVRLPNGTVGILRRLRVGHPKSWGIVRTALFGSTEVAASDELGLIAGPMVVAMQWLEHYRDED